MSLVDDYIKIVDIMRKEVYLRRYGFPIKLEEEFHLQDQIYELYIILFYGKYLYEKHPEWLREKNT